MDDELTSLFPACFYTFTPLSGFTLTGNPVKTHPLGGIHEHTQY